MVTSFDDMNLDACLLRGIYAHGFESTDDIFYTNPVKYVTGILPCPFDRSLVENETKSDGNPIIFLANAMEIP